MKITFTADPGNPKAVRALKMFTKRYGQTDLDKAEVVVVLGGDGTMLRVLQALLNYQTPVFGLNLGHAGKLLNQFSLKDLPDRVEQAEETSLIPLQIKAHTADGETHTQYAFNDFSFTRMSPQASRLAVSIASGENERPFIRQNVFGDGVIVATPVGTSGYYRSAKGVPVDATQNLIAVTSVCAHSDFNAVVSPESVVRVDVLEEKKRPVCVDRDGQDRITQVTSATISQATRKVQTLLKEKDRF